MLTPTAEDWHCGPLRRGDEANDQTGRAHRPAAARSDRQRGFGVRTTSDGRELLVGQVSTNGLRQGFAEMTQSNITEAFRTQDLFGLDGSWRVEEPRPELCVVGESLQESLGLLD